MESGATLQSRLRRASPVRYRRNPGPPHRTLPPAGAGGGRAPGDRPGYHHRPHSRARNAGPRHSHPDDGRCRRRSGLNPPRHAGNHPARGARLPARLPGSPAEDLPGSAGPAAEPGAAGGRARAGHRQPDPHRLEETGAGRAEGLLPLRSVRGNGAQPHGSGPVSHPAGARRRAGSGGAPGSRWSGTRPATSWPPKATASVPLRSTPGFPRAKNSPRIGRTCCWKTCAPCARP